MKPFLLILYLLLSLLSKGREENVAISSEAEGACYITAVQGYSVAANENFHSVSLRSFQSTRRSSPQTKSSFRFMKSGKVIDNKNLHPCLVLSYQLMTGLVFSQRYLHIICKLRI